MVAQDNISAPFAPYRGCLMGLCTNDNHAVFRWRGPGKILFSVTQQGLAASCHFASDHDGLRHLKKAIDEFVQFVFCSLKSVTMVLAQVKRSSVGRLIEKVGFMPVTKVNDITVYARVR